MRSFCSIAGLGLLVCAAGCAGAVSPGLRAAPARPGGDARAFPATVGRPMSDEFPEAFQPSGTPPSRDRLRFEVILPAATESVPDAANASSGEMDSSPGEAEPPIRRRLEARQCQCLAAEQSTFGRVLDAESRIASDSGGCRGRDDAASDCLRRRVLSARSIHERNTSAADALELFYRLAEAEGTSGWLDDALEELGAALDDCAALESQGIDTGVDEEPLRRQRSELVERRNTARHAMRQLDGQLKAMLGLPADPSIRLLAAAEPRIVPERIDADAAVERALERRGDLAALVALESAAGVETLPALRGALQAAQPGLGTASSAGRHVLGKSLADRAQQCELQSRRRQISELADSSRRQVEQEVRQAVSAAETALAAVRLAVGRRDDLRASLASLEKKREADGVTSFDLHAARLTCIDAEIDLLHRAIEWKIAIVRLKAAEGALAWECGYRLPGR